MKTRETWVRNSTESCTLLIISDEFVKVNSTLEREMTDFSISDEEYPRLMSLHKRTPNRRRADRTMAML